MAENESTPAGVDRQWFIVGRWQEFEGEARANLLRIIAIAAFYSVELMNYYGFQLGAIEIPKLAEPAFHQAVTAVAAAWAVMALCVLFCMSHRIFPSQLKYLTTACDLILLTATLMLGRGASSPLVTAYFFVIALSTLRFNLNLIRFTTIGATLGYLFVLGHDRWFTDGAFRVARYHQIIVLLALALTGIVLGQVIRRVQAVAKQYASRIESCEGSAS